MDFIKGLGSKISQTSQDLVSKTKEIADTTKLNGEIVTEEKNIVSTYQQLGEMYFKLNSETPEAELAEFIVKIKNSKANIASLKEEIRRVKGIKLCPGCNFESEGEVAFCPKCGTKLPELEVQSNDEEENAEIIETEVMQVKRCNTCSSELEENVVFCTSCGAKQ